MHARIILGSRAVPKISISIPSSFSGSRLVMPAPPLRSRDLRLVSPLWRLPVGNANVVIETDGKPKKRGRGPPCTGRRSLISAERAAKTRAKQRQLFIDQTRLTALEEKVAAMFAMPTEAWQRSSATSMPSRAKNPANLRGTKMAPNSQALTQTSKDSSTWKPWKRESKRSKTSSQC